MAGNELNLKSTTIEKGLDLAKSFIGKILGPAIDELGLLVADNIKYFRFKNQVRILIKANNYVERKNIKVKEIPTKILVPLLENASLEEDDKLQDEWARLIANMADSEQNLHSQIFPYLLGQISIEELSGLRELRAKETEYYQLSKKVDSLRKSEIGTFNKSKELQKLQEDKTEIEQRGHYIGLESYELSNLERLGLIKHLPPNIIIDEFQTGEPDYEGRINQWHQLTAEYEEHSSYHRITELGEIFLVVLDEKEKVGNKL